MCRTSGALALARPIQDRRIGTATLRCARWHGPLRIGALTRLILNLCMGAAEGGTARGGSCLGMGNTSLGVGDLELLVCDSERSAGGAKHRSPARQGWVHGLSRRPAPYVRHKPPMIEATTYRDSPVLTHSESRPSEENRDAAHRLINLDIAPFPRPGLLISLTGILEVDGAVGFLTEARPTQYSRTAVPIRYSQPVANDRTSS